MTTVQITDAVKQLFGGFPGATEDAVRAVILTPSSHAATDFAGLSFHLYLGHPDESSPYRLLVGASQRANEQALRVDFAYPLLPSLIAEVRTEDPLVVLQAFAHRFGMLIRIGRTLSRFVLTESIPLPRPRQATTILELLSEKPQAQAMCLFRVRNGDDTADVAFGFCVDTESYVAWLLGRPGDPDVAFSVAAPLRGHCTDRDLLSAEATVSFSIAQDSITRPGLMARLNGFGFALEFGIQESSLYLTRNGASVRRPIPILAGGERAYCYIGWSPNELRLIVLGPSSARAIEAGADELEEIGKQTTSLATAPTLPPNALLDWARRQAILPVETYPSDLDLFAAAVSALQSVPDIIATTASYNNFWDFTYQGRSILGRSPKREIDVGAGIDALLFNLALAKGFDFSRGRETGGGQLDGLVSARLGTGRMGNICLELKHAHSADLIHGATVQLPSYMRSLGTDCGVFVALWFKGRYFDEPTRFASPTDLALEVNAALHQRGLQGIRVEILDLSNPEPPSKR